LIRVNSRDSRAPIFPGDNGMADLIYKEECYKIIGACFEVYNDKGCGFLESVYQECLEIEHEYQQIPFVPQQPLRLFYRGKELKQKFIPDFICYGKIIVEIKAVSKLNDEHRSQVINYLNATGYELGILVNFGGYPKLEWERLVHTKKILKP
jgi:GxxExxY protein